MKELEIYNNRADLDSKTYTQACNKMKAIINSICAFLTKRKIKFEFYYPTESELYFDVYAPNFRFESGCSIDFQWEGSKDHIRIRTLSDELEMDGGETGFYIETYLQELQLPVNEEKLHRSILKGLTPRKTLMIIDAEKVCLQQM